VPEMENFYTASAEDYALYLDDGMPLAGRYVWVEVDTAELQIRLTYFLDEISAEYLVEAGIVEDLTLPDSTPLEPFFMQLWLEAKPRLVEQYMDFLKALDDPAQALAAQQQPEAADEIGNLYIISNYHLRQWAFHHVQIAPREFVELSQKPPLP
jgi:hypothetical protein